MPPDWSYFRRQLLDWYRPERRPMPWKAIDDPYRIWLSEIILQQTRVAQGLPYYERFVEAFPTVADLAAAEDDRVMKLWEGLGYYSRARNLLRAAREVVELHGGSFPPTYAGLRSLPGIGPYTAAAIGSFAFDLPTPVLDGNVYRVLSRFADDATPIDSGRGQKHFQAMVEAALGRTSARRFNQAIMDFGALVCTPKAADCPNCPLREHCAALAAGTVYDRPVKAKKLKKRTRYFDYLVIHDTADNYLLRQRPEGDVWQSLYDFPLLESEGGNRPVSELATGGDWPAGLTATELTFERSSPPYRQQLTHQTIIAVFHRFRCRQLPEGTPYLITPHKMFENLAFPRLLTRYLAEKDLLLDLF